MHYQDKYKKEHEFLALAQFKRDPKAFENLMVMHHGRIKSVLQRFASGNRAVAEDLAQEVFWKAWNALPTFRADAKFSTWLHRIAYLEFLQYQRRIGNTPSQADSVVPELVIGSDEDLVGALRIDMQNALALLDPAEAAAIIHCYYGDLSHSEAAHVMAIPLGTLKSLVLRGRDKMRLRLAAWKSDKTMGNSHQ
jgi:RNA polymerase sigma factor (sigma-70 family)